VEPSWCVSLLKYDIVLVALIIFCFFELVLVILDRNIDLSVMVSHSWTYQAVIHDLLGLKLNRVKLEVAAKDDSSSSSSKATIRTYDLDSEEPFWAEHAASPFPKVAVEIQEQVKEVQSKMSKVAELRDAEGGSTSSDTPALRTNEIKDIVSSIPELQEKKRILDMHATIALELLDHINKRSLDKFFQLEESIMIKPSSQHRSEVLSMISDAKGSALDKLRLFLIYFMAQKKQLEKQELEEFEAALSTAGVDLSALRYLQKFVSTALSHFLSLCSLKHFFQDPCLQ
jgi:sec1 family domain-containing protein 1